MELRNTIDKVCAEYHEDFEAYQAGDGGAELFLIGRIVDEASGVITPIIAAQELEEYAEEQ